MHRGTLSLLCLLNGCLPKGTAAVDDLMQLEAFDVACTLGGPEARAALSPQVWDRAAPMASATRLTPDEIGGTPSGWEMWRLDREVAPAVLAHSVVGIELLDEQGRAWLPCTECTQEWVARQFTPPTRDITYNTHSNASGGGFFRGLAELGKAFLLPFTLLVDLTVVLPMNLFGADVKPATVQLFDNFRFASSPRPANVPPEEHLLPPDLRVFRPPAPDSTVASATFTLHGSFHDGCALEPLSLSADVRDGSAQAVR